MLEGGGRGNLKHCSCGKKSAEGNLREKEKLFLKIIKTKMQRKMFKEKEKKS